MQKLIMTAHKMRPSNAQYCMCVSDELWSSSVLCWTIRVPHPEESHACTTTALQTYLRILLHAPSSASDLYVTKQPILHSLDSCYSWREDRSLEIHFYKASLTSTQGTMTVLAYNILRLLLLLSFEKPVL